MEGRCGAKLRLSEPARYCKHAPTPGRQRCRLHGGMTPSGIGSPHFQHGRFSLYMPERLRGDYELALSDPERLSLQREVAAHRATANDLRKRLEAGEATGDGLQTAWRDFKAAHRSGSAERLADALTRVDAAVQQRATEDALRKELRDETELIAKLTKGENDRMEQLHQMVTREQALNYMRGLALTVRAEAESYVRDVDTRRAFLRSVSAKFEQLAGGRGGEDAEPGGQHGEAVGSRPGH